ncbi:hypothetical protein MY3296_006543 [Beauveria thailandica]
MITKQAPQTISRHYYAPLSTNHRQQYLLRTLGTIYEALLRTL